MSFPQNAIIDLVSYNFQVAALPLMVGHYQHHTGLPENLSSCHMGGLYSSTFFLGSFLGPLGGGFIINLSSYGLSCTIAGVLLLVAVLLVSGLHLSDKTLLNPWVISVDPSPDIYDTLSSNGLPADNISR